jgi:hypothetical protein
VIALNATLLLPIGTRTPPPTNQAAALSLKFVVLITLPSESVPSSEVVVRKSNVLMPPLTYGRTRPLGHASSGPKLIVVIEFLVVSSSKMRPPIDSEIGTWRVSLP